MPANKTSSIWEHYVSLTKTKAWCVYCQTTISRTDNSTGNMARHLSNCQPEKYAEFDKSVIEKKKEKAAKKRRLEVCKTS